MRSTSRNLKYLLAPFGVAVGSTVFITVSLRIAALLGVTGLSSALNFVPLWILALFGIGLIVAWLPIFLLGDISIGSPRRGRPIGNLKNR